VDLPNITADCVTWPAFQNVIRKCWAGANGEWVPLEHAQPKDVYHGCHRSHTLQAKKDGFAKMVKEMGQDKVNEEMWGLYMAWPVPAAGATEVTRYNRKKMAKTGEAEDMQKATWPLPFSGDNSVSSMLIGCGFSEAEVAGMKTALIDDGPANGLHPNCTEAEVTWPDIQQAFRSTMEEGDWTEEHDAENPPLNHKVTLRNKIEKDQIADLLAGEYRMYCSPDNGEAFSYGLIIEDIDIDNMTFGGRSRVEGKYEVENGKIEQDQHLRVHISYEEVWPNGTRDALSARVKSNAKFQCESTGGYEQKATNETKNLPEDPEDRIGQAAKEGVKKYYAYDADAATA
jgi:hypothetical protein